MKNKKRNKVKKVGEYYLTIPEKAKKRKGKLKIGNNKATEKQFSDYDYLHKLDKDAALFLFHFNNAENNRNMKSAKDLEYGPKDIKRINDKGNQRRRDIWNKQFWKKETPNQPVTRVDLELGNDSWKDAILSEEKGIDHPNPKLEKLDLKGRYPICSTCEEEIDSMDCYSKDGKVIFEYKCHNRTKKIEMKIQFLRMLTLENIKSLFFPEKVHFRDYKLKKD